MPHPSFAPMCPPSPDSALRCEADDWEGMADGAKRMCSCTPESAAGPLCGSTKEAFCPRQVGATRQEWQLLLTIPRVRTGMGDSSSKIQSVLAGLGVCAAGLTGMKGVLPLRTSHRFNPASLMLSALCPPPPSSSRSVAVTVRVTLGSASVTLDGMEQTAASSSRQPGAQEEKVQPPCWLRQHFRFRRFLWL